MAHLAAWRWLARQPAGASRLAGTLSGMHHVGACTDSGAGAIETTLPNTLVWSAAAQSLGAGLGGVICTTLSLYSDYSRLLRP